MAAIAASPIVSMQVFGRWPQESADAICIYCACEFAESSLIGLEQLFPDRPDFILIRDFQCPAVTVTQTVNLHENREAVAREFSRQRRFYYLKIVGHLSV